MFNNYRVLKVYNIRMVFALVSASASALELILLSESEKQKSPPKGAHSINNYFNSSLLVLRSFSEGGLIFSFKVMADRRALRLR